MENRKSVLTFKAVSFLLTFFLTVVASVSFSAPMCSSLFIESFTQTTQQTSTAQSRQRTQLEAELSRLAPPLPVADRLNFEINRLRTSNPELARQVLEVKGLKERGKSVAADKSQVPTHMNIFIDGAYAKVVGARGLSRPFVTFESPNESTLIIRHIGDKFPMMVRWKAETQSIGTVRSENIDGVIYQILDVPASFKNKNQLDQVQAKHIHALISGSALNKYIPSNSSQIITIASALHDGRLVFDRPTQAEAKEVRKLIGETKEINSKIKSLLFVAPTASGKTRVLGDAIVEMVQKQSDKKLIILTTKTPDLTAELGRNIGTQLHQEVGMSKFRILQWGGQASEAMTFAQLQRFVEQSPVPVVLVTSYPTLAARTPSAKEKADLLKEARGLLVDEAHNATGTTFSQVMTAAKQVEGIEILGVTASPITRTQRTAELYDGVFWASVDKPGLWVQERVRNFDKVKDSERAIEWTRMAEQYKNAMDRGEINASEPQYYSPEARGFKFASIFKRAEAGTASSVHLERLKDIWPDVATMIEGHGPGVIHTYPRDAEPVAQLLSALSGKNYVSLQKMSQNERTLVYEAFRTGKEHNGKTVDAIVGTIREGLDFPQAGWYLNFKKYVKFPENIQGPGRVVRLAHNKLNPVIMFFGDEIDRTSYVQVKDLVMSRLGRLPRQLPEGRLFTGMRRQGQREAMAKAIENLNSNMEAFFRLQAETTKQLGTKENLNPEAIKQLQTVLNDIRYSSRNREIDLALNQFVAESHSYPFFRGELKSSWALAEKLVSLSKLTPEQLATKRISDLERQYLAKPEVVEMAKEFRGFLANIGPIPRAVLETMNLKLLNVTEVAEAANTFVRNHNKAPTTEQFGQNYLSTMLDHSMAISPQGLWRALSPQAKALLGDKFDARSKQGLETTVNEFFASTKQLPEFSIDIAISRERDVTTNLSNRLAVEMNKKVLSGEVIVAELTPEVRLALEGSEAMAGMVIKLRQNLDGIKNETVATNEYIQRLKEEGYFQYENLMHTSELGLMKTLKDMADLNPNGPAAKYVELIQKDL